MHFPIEAQTPSKSLPKTANIYKNMDYRWELQGNSTKPTL
jgi:hypothetical protein